MIQKEFRWLRIIENIKWLGLFEIKIADYNEIYRIIIDYEFYNGDMFCHYKFERFDFHNREWSMKLKDSPFSYTVYYNIKTIFLEHIRSNNILNVIITFSSDNPKRNVTSKYFCNILIKDGFKYIENFQPTFTAMLCLKSNKLSALEDKALREYINTPLRNISFFS